ncbi:hypothetical protein [Parafrankia soli]|uniref:hypothetical protein n=1 Tax=Parafrankia soli TaxID=2599596 RepID=UPI003B587EB1
MTNDDLTARFDTSDAWIRERTGIHTRHVVAPGESTADLAVRALRRIAPDDCVPRDRIRTSPGTNQAPATTTTQNG